MRVQVRGSSRALLPSLVYQEPPTQPRMKAQRDSRRGARGIPGWVEREVGAPIGGECGGVWGSVGESE